MEQALVQLPHALVGALALAAFWRTALSVKGSPAHRRRGRLYLLLLAPLLASVLPIMLAALAERGPVALVQLAYLALVVAAAGWTAWRAIRDRGDPEAFRGPVFRALACALTGMACLLMVMGIATQNLMAFGFSVIGIVYGGAMLGFLGSDPAPGWSLRWHLNGVALLFAATHASFAGLVLRKLRPDWDGEVLHGLTQFGVIALAWFGRQWLAARYERRAPATPGLPA